MKLSWARNADADPSDPAATGEDAPPQAVPFELAAVDLITVSGRHLGWIATDGERTSDWLNGSDEVVVHGLRDIPLGDELTVPVMPGSEGLATQRLKRQEIIFAVPPPLPPNRHLRLHRRKVRINLEIGDYRVSGQLHVRPGADAGDYVLRSSRTMVPLTEVELVHTGDPEFRMLLSVLILNARKVTRLREADGQGDRAAPHTPAPAAAAPAAAAPAVRPLAPEPSAPTGDPAADPAADQATDPMAALTVLLEAGLLDITEFQAKRAELLARSKD